MYLWNTKALSRDLKRNRLSEKEKMKYFLAYALTISLVVFFGSIVFSNPGLEILFFPIGIGITIWGINHCYRENQKRDNCNFIERAVCLSIPLFIKVILVPFLIFVLSLIVLEDKGIRVGSFAVKIFNLIVAVIFYYKLGLWIAQVAHKDKPKTSPSTTEFLWGHPSSSPLPGSAGSPTRSSD